MVRPETAAAQVIARLARHGACDPDLLDECARRLKQGGGAATAFWLLSRSAPSTRIGRGWNKYWTDAALNTWLGGRILSTTLTAIVVEAAALPPAAPLSWWIEEASRVYCLTAALPAPPPQASDIGLSAEEPSRTLRFIGRVNLMRREQPEVEAWRWSRSGGMAYLTNGGRIKVSADYAWLRAVESSLLDDQTPAQDGLDFLESATEFTSIALPTNPSDALEMLLDRLAWFGLIRRHAHLVELLHPSADSAAYICKSIFS